MCLRRLSELAEIADFYCFLAVIGYFGFRAVASYGLQCNPNLPFGQMVRKMAHQPAGTAGTTTKPQRRKWRNRRPPVARLDLTPDERAAAEEREKRKQLTAGLCVQFTPDDKAEIKKRAKASGNSLSDFVRIVLLSDLKAPAPPAHDPAVIADLCYQLSKIGTNLNQLAKVANERRELPREAELKAVSERIVSAIERVLAL